MFIMYCPLKLRVKQEMLNFDLRLTLNLYLLEFFLMVKNPDNYALLYESKKTCIRNSYFLYYYLFPLFLQGYVELTLIYSKLDDLLRSYTWNIVENTCILNIS